MIKLIQEHLSVVDGNTQGTCPSSNTEINVEPARTTLDNCPGCDGTAIMLRELVARIPTYENAELDT